MIRKVCSNRIYSQILSVWWAVRTDFFSGLALLLKHVLKIYILYHTKGCKESHFLCLFLQLDLCCFFRNNGDIAFFSIPLKISHRLSLLQPSAATHSISSNAIHVCSFQRDA